MDHPYKVVDQHEEMARRANGDVMKVVKVTAQLQSGATFSIEVPREAYDADYVKQLLDLEASHFAAVDSIGN